MTYIPEDHKRLALSLLSDAQLQRVLDDLLVDEEHKVKVREEIERRKKR